jgi:hypothetical protein
LVCGNGATVTARSNRQVRQSRVLAGLKSGARPTW